MKRPFSILCLPLALAVSVGAQGATRLSGALDGFYSGQWSGGSSNTFGGGGQMLVSFAQPGLNLQLSGSGATISSGGLSANAWVGDADFFWRDAKGSFGASVAHGSVGISIFSADITAYGGFGEWFPTRNLTLRMKGGGITGDASGSYGGVGGEFYFGPNASTDVEYTYISLSGLTIHTGSAGANMQFLNEVPLALRIAYDFTSTSGVTASGVSVSLRYRFGAGGSLVESDRNGPLTWNGALSLL